MPKSKSFDSTVRKMCSKKISDPDCELLGDSFTVEQAIAAAVIKKAMSGTADSVKLIREILDDQKTFSGEFRVDIKVVE